MSWIKKSLAFSLNSDGQVLNQYVRWFSKRKECIMQLAHICFTAYICGRFYISSLSLHTLNHLVSKFSTSTWLLYELWTHRWLQLSRWSRWTSQMRSEKTGYDLAPQESLLRGPTQQDLTHFVDQVQRLFLETSSQGTMSRSKAELWLCDLNIDLDAFLNLNCKAISVNINEKVIKHCCGKYEHFN